MAKSLVITSALWATGGLLGLHHLYLGRFCHAVLWMLTFGLFGVGWLYDLFHLREYLNDANGEEEAMAALKALTEKHPTPPFSLMRCAGEYVIGRWLVLVYMNSVSTGLDNSLDTTIVKLIYIILFKLAFPLATGIWLVGSIGRERVSFKIILVSIFVSVFALHSELLAIAPIFVVNWIGKNWQLEPHTADLSKDLKVFTLWTLTHAALYYAALNNNPEVRDTITAVVRPVWNDLWSSLEHARQKVPEREDYLGYKGFRSSDTPDYLKLDPKWEDHAEQILGVRYQASQAELTSAYRRMSRVWHPDKWPHPGQKKEASARFILIQQAYETLSKISNKRKQQGKGEF